MIIGDTSTGNKSTPHPDPGPAAGGPPHDRYGVLGPWWPVARQLAAWLLARCVAHQGVHGYYRVVEYLDDRGEYLRDVTPQTARRGLTRDDLLNHVIGHSVGVHAIAADGTCRWVALDFDNHAGDAGTAGRNEADALRVYELAVRLGFRPLLVRSGSPGGFHLWLFLVSPVASELAYRFIRWLIAEAGVTSTPEAYPKQARLGKDRDGRDQVGNWLRLPGRHHRRGVWSTAWDGSRWLDPSATADLILTLAGDDPALIPAGVDAVPVPEDRTTTRSTTATRPAGGFPRVGDDVGDKKARAYFRKLPNLAEGEGRNAAAYRAYAFMIGTLGFDEAKARQYLDAWDAANLPPLGAAELSAVIDSARRHARGEAEKDGCDGSQFLKPTPSLSSNSSERGIPLDESDQDRFKNCEPSQPAKVHAHDCECSNPYRTPWLEGWGAAQGTEGRAWVRCRSCPGCKRWKQARDREQLLYGLSTVTGQVSVWEGDRADWPAVRRRLDSAPYRTVRHPDGSMTAVILGTVPGLRQVDAPEAVRMYDHAVAGLPDPLPARHRPLIPSRNWPVPNPEPKKGGYRVAGIGPALLDDEIEAVADELGVPIERDGLAGSGGVVRSVMFNLRGVEPDKAAKFHDRIRRPPDIVVPSGVVPSSGAWYLLQGMHVIPEGGAV